MCPESKKLEGRHCTIDVATRDPASGPRVQGVSHLVIYVGDGNQSPEGINAQRLRSELMRLPIGLRAG